MSTTKNRNESLGLIRDGAAYLAGHLLVYLKTGISVFIHDLRVGSYRFVVLDSTGRPVGSVNLLWGGASYVKAALAMALLFAGVVMYLYKRESLPET